MKLRAVFAILASLLAASVFAQMPPPGPPMDMDRMALLLDLDGYQKTEVK